MSSMYCTSLGIADRERTCSAYLLPDLVKLGSRYRYSCSEAELALHVLFTVARPSKTTKTRVAYLPISARADQP